MLKRKEKKNKQTSTGLLCTEKKSIITLQQQLIINGNIPCHWYSSKHHSRTTTSTAMMHTQFNDACASIKLNSILCNCAIFDLLTNNKFQYYWAVGTSVGGSVGEDVGATAGG